MKRVSCGSLGRIMLSGMIMASAGSAALAGGPYDGTYHGTLTGGDSNAVSCAKRAPIQMTVADNKLEYHHMGNAVVTATVGSDGSFSGSSHNTYTAGRGGGLLVTTVEGKIAGGLIKAEGKTGNYCTYQLQLKRF